MVFQEDVNEQRVRASGTFVIILDEKKFMRFICLVHLAADV